MSIVLSTEAVRPRERLSYWIDAVCSTYAHIDCSVADPARIMDGSIQAQELELIELTVSRSFPQTVHRTREKIAKFGSDHFLLHMPTFGTCVVEQSGRRAIVKPGDFALYDLGRPFQIHFLEDFEVRVVKLPRSLIRAHMPTVDDLTAMTVAASSGAGPLILSMFDQIYSVRSPISRSPQAGAALAEAFTGIVAAGLWTLASAEAGSLRHMTRFHLERARRYIQQNLTNPRLSPATLAGALGLSPSHLHRLFQGQSMSPMEVVRAMRLERCRTDLVQATKAHQSISEIAFAAGFSNVAHFSRSFRKEFGMSPREWRRSKGSSLGIDESQPKE